ncbi:MAG: transposase [bacterium]|nr:transposase [bacterium]
MDETGCSLAAEPTYSWCPSGQPVCVPKQAGKPSRVNVIGGLGLCGGRWRLEWQVVEGRVNAETVVAWLERLAARASRARPVVVVWDRASYHTARVVESRFGAWASRGLFVYVLPAYSPQLNLVERCWLELKARLLPRRWYADVCALRAGVETGLEALAAQVEQGLFNI